MALFGRLLLLVLIHACSADVFPVTDGNVTLLHNHRVALIQFSAEWCHFSRQLTPIFHAASQNFTEETKVGDVALGRVNCEESTTLCAQEKIRKYPTIKMLKYGITSKREYRGPRTVESLVAFVRDHLADNITVIDAQQEKAPKVFSGISETRETIIAVFPKFDTSNHHYQHFLRVAHIERDSCAFYVIHNVTEEGDRLAHKQALTQQVKEITLLKGADFRAIHSWIMRKCTVPVRELTFANAEEITDEGLPLLLLFVDPKSAKLKQIFYELVSLHFSDEQGKINFLIADGIQFSHPLTHLGKSARDLPLICIDSLVHMYGHPLPAHVVLDGPDLLRKFIDDLRSGKLHREFHYGPDAGTPEANVPKQPGTRERIDSEPTDPPKSVFKHLGPSYRKYTILRDEF